MDLDFYDDIRIIVKKKQWKSIIHKNLSINDLCVSVFDIEAVCFHTITCIGVWSCSLS